MVIPLVRGRDKVHRGAGSGHGRQQTGAAGRPSRDTAKMILAPRRCIAWVPLATIPANAQSCQTGNGQGAG